MAFVTKASDEQVSWFDRMVSESSVMHWRNESCVRILELSMPNVLKPDYPDSLIGVV
ncbi:MAG: hypothetical protein ACYDHX_05225 [Methanothrix sp.]